MRARALAPLLVLLLATACGGPSAAARRAQTLVDAGDYAGAAQLAEAELASNPRDGDLWRVRMRAALGQNDATAAVAHYHAWRALRGSDDPAAMRMMAMTTLWQALESPSVDARVAAIQAVERLEIEQLADAVADRMADDEDLVAAAAAIAILKSFPQAPQLATDLLRSDDAGARAICVEGIGRKVGARAADDLRALADDGDAGVRRAVVRALAAIADPADTELLTQMAGDQDTEVRAAALTALARGKRGDQTALAISALTDEHLGVRLAAVKLLGGAGARSQLAALLTGADLVIAAHAARELARDLPTEAAAALDRALADADWTIRAGALNLAQAVVGKDGMRRRAAGALDDQELAVRLAAARLLGDASRATAIFAEALGDASLRIGAAIDLARLGDPRGLDTLDQLVTDDSTALAAASGYAAARRLAGGVVTALASPNPAVRLAAAESILRVARVEE